MKQTNVLVYVKEMGSISIYGMATVSTRRKMPPRQLWYKMAIMEYQLFNDYNDYLKSN